MTTPHILLVIQPQYQLYKGAKPVWQCKLALRKVYERPSSFLSHGGEGETEW